VCQKIQIFFLVLVPNFNIATLGQQQMKNNTNVASRVPKKKEENRRAKKPEPIQLS